MMYTQRRMIRKRRERRTALTIKAKDMAAMIQELAAEFMAATAIVFLIYLMTIVGSSVM